MKNQFINFDLLVDRICQGKVFKKDDGFFETELYPIPHANESVDDMGNKDVWERTWENPEIVFKKKTESVENSYDSYENSYSNVVEDSNEDDEDDDDYRDADPHAQVREVHHRALHRLPAIITFPGQVRTRPARRCSGRTGPW